MRVESMSKKMRKLLREYAECACEKEMSLALEELLHGMQEWRQGKKTVHQLNEEIHQYHNKCRKPL